MSRYTRNRPVRIIDHEPLENRGTFGRPFGRRQGTAAKRDDRQDDTLSPVSDTAGSARGFFSFRYEDNATEQESGMISRSWKAIAACLFIFLAGPAIFMSLVEQLHGFRGIDPMTTASIPAGSGFSVANIEMSQIFRNGATVVTIRGGVTNTDLKARPIPELVITLYDEKNRKLQRWHHRPGIGKLDARDKFRFITSAIDTSGRAKHVTVTAGH